MVGHLFRVSLGLADSGGAIALATVRINMRQPDKKYQLLADVFADVLTEEALGGLRAALG